MYDHARVGRDDTETRLRYVRLSVKLKLLKIKMFYTNSLTMHKTQNACWCNRKAFVRICLYVQDIFHWLKPVDYLHVLTLK